MVGLQTAYTPPHQPPSAEEAARSTSLELVIKQRSAPFIAKVSVTSVLTFHPILIHHFSLSAGRSGWGNAQRF